MGELVVGGEHDDLGVRGKFQNLLGRVQTVLAGHLDVHQHQVGVIFLGACHRLRKLPPDELGQGTPLQGSSSAMSTRYITSLLSLRYSSAKGTVTVTRHPSPGLLAMLTP